MEARAYVNQMPVFMFNSTGSFGRINSLLEVFVIANTTKIPVFTIQIDLRLGGKAVVTGRSLIPSLYFIDFDLSLYSSNIGNFTVMVTGIEDIINEIVNFVIPFVNDKLSVGFLLPVVGGVSLQNTLITYGKNKNKNYFLKTFFLHIFSFSTSRSWLYGCFHKRSSERTRKESSSSTWSYFKKIK